VADKFARARAIANSHYVLRVFAAPEWDELGDDGKQWIAEIVHLAQLPLAAANERADLNAAACAREADARRAAEAEVARLRVAKDAAWAIITHAATMSVEAECFLAAAIEGDTKEWSGKEADLIRAGAALSQEPGHG
jgi:hypothetical protein